tara:strand:+ start:1144 stop:1344 length:201 start_codon:yes stop_codon:yes gene_type:complete
MDRDKKIILEQFDLITGRWEKVERTIEEIENMNKVDELDLDMLDAEYEIIQRSIELELGINDKSTD